MEFIFMRTLENGRIINNLVAATHAVVKVEVEVFS
jgi:hypothetical protein